MLGLRHKQLAQLPAIHSCASDGIGPDLIKYIQFLGERYLPDSEVFQNVSFPYTSARCPSALEIVTSVCGSSKAEEILANEIANTSNLAGILENASNYFESLPQAYWEKSMYTRWLDTLSTLTTYEKRPQSTVFPWFTQIEPWKTLRLNSILASWTQLRHDVVLLGKNTWVPMPGNWGPGYVEPVSEFWDKLYNLVYNLNVTCSSFFQYINADPNDPDSNDYYMYKGQIKQLLWFCSNYGDYAKKLEQGQTLSSFEQIIIRNFGLGLQGFFSEHVQDESPALVVDVLSEPNVEVTLHEATGHFNPILVAYRHNNTFVSGAGLVFSYYEFQTPITERLTDTEWLDMLDSENSPQRPYWTKDFLNPQLFVNPNPYTSTSETTTTITAVTSSTEKNLTTTTQTTTLRVTPGLLGLSLVSSSLIVIAVRHVRRIRDR